MGLAHVDHAPGQFLDAVDDRIAVDADAGVLVGALDDGGVRRPLGRGLGTGEDAPRWRRQTGGLQMPFQAHAVLRQAHRLRRRTRIREAALLNLFSDLGIAPRPACQFLSPVPDEPLMRIERVEKRQIVEERERPIGVALPIESVEQRLPRLVSLSLVGLRPVRILVSDRHDFRPSPAISRHRSDVSL